MNHARNDTLYRGKEDRNILHEIKRRMVNWIGHNWHSNCHLNHVIEGKIEGRTDATRRRGRSYGITLRKGEDTGNWKRKHWIILGGGFGRCSGPHTQRTTEWVNQRFCVFQLYWLHHFSHTLILINFHWYIFTPSCRVQKLYHIIQSF